MRNIPIFQPVQSRRLSPAHRGTKGFICGGIGTDGTNNIFYNRIDRYSFLTEVTASTGRTISVGRWGFSVVNSPRNTSYVVAGNDGTIDRTTIDEINFPTETCRTLSTTVTRSKYLMAANQSLFAGYFFGGWSSSPSIFNDIDRMSFQTFAMTRLSAALSRAVSYVCGISSAYQGYVAGGSIDTSLSTLSSRIERFVYGTEIASTLAATLPATRRSISGISGDLNGYFVGGLASAGEIAAIERFSYLTEARTTISATVSVTRSGTFNTSLLGFLVGGVAIGGTFATSIARLNLITEVLSGASASLYAAQYQSQLPHDCIQSEFV